MILLIRHAYVHFLTITATLRCLLYGDFNYPNIDWSEPVNTGSMCSSLFLTSILQNGLTQHVNLPTRGNHCIDLVMVSDVSMMFDISVVDPFVVSCDHSSVEFMVICPCIIPQTLSRIVEILVLQITL